MVRILWIEDEAYTDLGPYKTAMVEAGYLVDIAETAEDAFDYLNSMTYDAYIVDLLLPQKNAFKEYIEYPGIEILKKMIDEYKINSEKVIVFTVMKDKKVMEEIENIGVKRIITKGLQPIYFLKEEVDKLLQDRGE